MNQPNFLEGVAVAIIVSVIGSAVAFLLTPLIGRGTVLYLLVCGIGFVYLLYLLTSSNTRVGRISAVFLWMAVTGITWLAGLPLMIVGLTQVGFIWLARSLYFYSSALAALLDLGLTALSLAGAFWAAAHSGSLFLGIWVFFLTQALFVAIPQRWPRRSAYERSQDDPFQRAYRSAEAAVRRLSANH